MDARNRRKDDVVARCGCGRIWTREGWNALPLVGRQVVKAGDGWPEYVLELRDCWCGSTIGEEKPK